MPSGRKDTSAMGGTLSAPPTYSGTPAPIQSAPNPRPSVEFSASSDTVSLSATASTQAVTVLHTAAAIVICALALLWVFGGIVFKNANL